MADALPFVAFSASLLALCVVERLAYALLSLFLGGGEGKHLRAGLVVGSFLNLVSTLAGVFVGVVVRIAGYLGWIFFWYAVLYCLSAFWFVLYEEQPEVVIYLADFYSKRVGPFLHGYLFLPLDLLNLVLKGVLPLYNGVVWVLRGMLSKGLLPILWDEIGLLVDFGVALLGLGKGLSMSVVDFVGGLSCDDLSCLERPATFDLLGPMGSVRDLAVVTSKFGGAVCSALSLPIDWVVYPLVDVRFSRGLHAVLNSFLHLVLHVPRAASKRCDAYGGSGSHVDVLMCTPDLEPVFDHAVSGLRELGGAVDNWLGVGSAMARRSLTGLPDDCSPRSAGPERFRGDLLSGLQTVVGLTDWLMAATNGTFAYFWGQVTTDTALRPWPEPVEVSFGLAAVSFDEAGEVEVSGVTQGQRPAARRTTSLMGCRCLDTDQGVVVRCAVLPLSGAASSGTHAFDVQFQDRTWARAMECRGVEVSVRSVRWPVRRYEGKSVPFSAGFVDLPGADCMSRGSCESVDATIWLVPRCDALRPEQCSDAAVGTSCFPFCMAARVSGSRNANPVFVNAEAWRTGKQLLMRDCALGASGATAGTALSPSRATVATAAFAQTTLSGAARGAPLFVSGAGDGSACFSGANLVSWVPSNATPADPRSVPAYLRRRGQPFAIFGDAVLTEFLAPDGASTVEVDRLSGNQRDVYSLIPGWAGLPAAPKFLVPVEELASEERGRIVVPLDLSATRVPSTGSRNYVFYGVSPDLRIFEAYLEYCRDSSALPRAQYMMLSSYSALRVYRVRAYCQESCESGELVSQFTFDGFSDGKFDGVEFPQDCGRVYNASIDALEYVNEQNLAVTVQVADRTYDPALRYGSNSTYVTYWLNPQTMRARRGDMWPTELPSSLTAGLCVAGDGVPHVGTLGAELAVAGLQLVRRGVGALVYAPGMVAFWRGGASCPLQSRGHSVLASCGRDVFDLDDFFDSLDSAAAVFWGIPGWVAEQMEQGKVVDYSPVSDLLRGFGVYGRGAVGISGITGGVLSLLNTPLPEQFSEMYAVVRQPGSVAGVSKMVVGASSWARFTSRFFATVGASLAQKLVVDGSLDLGVLWRDMINALYDQRPFFKTTVTDRGISACLGLEMMVGGANPPGRVLYHSCQSSVRLLDGAMDVFLHAFVDAPMVKCVCKDSEGKLAGAYAREHCVWKAPVSMQPTLLGMVSASEGLIGGDSLLCPAVVAYTRSALESTMEPYFSTMYSSLEALGDSVDYMLSGYDTDSGQCSSFRSDPQVVVIMPEPVDYFRGCGATSYCKARCAGSWDAFSEAAARYQPALLTGSREMERTVDSLFFPSVVSDMIAPGQVVALARPDACGDWVCRSPGEDCLAAASVVREELRVTFYCVPSAPSLAVYASERGELPWSSGVGHDASQLSFLKNDGSAMVALVGPRLLLLRRSEPPKVVMDVEQILSLPLVGQYPLRIIDFMPVGQRLLVNVAVRTSRDARFERDVGTVWFSPLDVVDPYTNPLDYFPPVVTSGALRDLWRGYAVSEYPSGGVEGESVLILWPVTSGGFLKRAVLTWTNATVSARVEPIQQSRSLVARATLMPRKLVLSKTLREDTQAGQLVMYASAGNVYDWLRQLRLTGSGLAMSSASLSNAQPVAATIGINTSCDGLDCRGCPDLALRSLCSAYQSCAVFRCIGTPVNLKRPLCGVGQVLKSVGNMGVANVQGAWVMFVDIFMILLQLKTVRNLPGVDVTFPDDSFMSNVCAAKDVSAEFFSILTSTVNSILQRVQSSGGVFSRFSAIDASVHTLVSMSMAAITGFLHQIALAPVYVLSVGHKIMMCQVSGTLAVASGSGTRVSIQSARFSSTDAISGQCITVGAEVNAQQTGDPQAVRGVTSNAAEVLTGAGQVGAMRRLEPFMHMVDGTLTYFIGMAAKLADVLQATDVQHCVLPDVTLRSAVRCACGDKPLAIVAQRRREGLGEHAHWCTGTLSLITGDNRVQVVWNPYTYEELQRKVGSRLDEYVVAASGSTSAAAPNEAVFEEQGVSMFAVLTRCRQNYVNKQWDPSAFVLYDPLVAEREIQGGARPAAGDPEDGVGRCLLDSVDKGAGNGACLDSFLRSRGLNSLYWGYELVNDTVGSQLLDACLVFSGPASNPGFSEARRKVFRDCLSGYANQSACDLSGFVWSPASSNSVPVAVRHPVRAGNGSHLEDAVAERMRAASDMVMSRLRALSDFSNDKLRAVLFSAEGDVIHQLMDCVFMGPYARVDYWPVPRCDEAERDDCLVGPYWSRDAGGGRSRGVDASTCDAAGELPFTCGSPTRKAMVRDFVRQYLEAGDGAEVVTEIVREWIANQTQTWWDPLSFGCDCPSCCDGFLPRKLSGVSLQVSTRGIMNALEDRLGRFYRASMSSPEPWISELAALELAKYDWAASGGANQIQALGAFHPSVATQRYDSGEAAAPPTTFTGASLWRVCHSALRQVMFTMPVDDDGGLQGNAPAFSGGGPEAIAAHVKLLVERARDLSPLFRHYQPRHHPSASRVCHGAASRDPKVVRGGVRFSNYTVRGNVIFDGTAVPPIPTLAYDAAVLGGRWNGTYMGLTEHLGFLDRDATESWLRGGVELTTSAEFLLRYGPGGLKVGNLPGAGEDLGLPEDFAGDLDGVLRESVREEDRLLPLESAPVHGCEAHAQNHSELLGAFVDALFPMAQGVRESGVGSYCLRFAIELSMLYAMELVPELDVAHLVSQKELALTWRRRCGTQVQLVGMCNALDLYHYQSMQSAACMFSWHLVRDPGVEMYITPECLVKIGDYFYDPCKCRPEWCEPRETTQLLRRSDIEDASCQLRFDPRAVVQSAELGWWAEDDGDASAAAWNAWLEDPVNLLDLDGLREGLLSDGRSVGNVPAGGEHWASAEGFMNATGDYCDMIADYWPEGSAFPVGYHVTTPCHKDDAGYRSFDNVFAEGRDVGGEPVLFFMEDQTRDADLVDSHFGAGGLCRGVNFGFDMYETNTMRVCTRVTSGEDVDVHVPRGGEPDLELGLPRCSQSSTDLPWGDGSFYDYYDAAFFSVGTVPNLPSGDAGVYPENADRYMRIGPQHAMREDGWGDSCQDFVMPNCSEGPRWACPEDFVCRAPGVCLHKSVQCTRHAECSEGRMCSGLGTCEVPSVSVENQFADDVGVRAHTASCPGESFSMRGASYWGYVPDLLEAHGMCSYRHWQEYLYTISRCCGGSNVPGECRLEGSTCPVYRFSKDQSINKWWNQTDNAPTRLKMIPTTCDRDYERFKRGGRELLSCVPSPGTFWLIKPDGAREQSASRDKLWRMYDDSTRSVPVLLMPFVHQPSNGFLGVNSTDNIMSCMSIQQCFVDVFTKNGAAAMYQVEGVRKPNRTLRDGSMYDPDDQFRCGVIGYYDRAKSKCVVDEKLFPLYYVLCRESPRVGLQKCQSSLKQNSIPARCDDVRHEYDPEYSTINDVNVPALNRFFYVFNQPSTLAEHLNLVECMEHVYGTMSRPPFDSRGLYVPFTFTLYEIPFSWFYQCMIGSGIEVSLALDKRLFPCTFYRNRRTLEVEASSPSSPTDYYRDFPSYVFNVRGGYKRSAIEAERLRQLGVITQAWEAAVEEVRSNWFGAAGSPDNTFPSCYSEMTWDLPNDNRFKRKMIEAKVRNTCANNLLNVYIQQYNQFNGPSRAPVDASTVINDLTHVSGALVSQRGASESNRLLTGLIKRFGTTTLQQQAALGSISVAQAPIRLNSDMPPVASPQFALQRSVWRGLNGVLPNQVSEITKELPNSGTLKDVYVDSTGFFWSEEDTDTQAGMGTRVQAYSVYATGYFSCFYPDFTLGGQTVSLRGNRSGVEGQFDAYANALYTAVKQRYDLKIAAHRDTGVLRPIHMNNLSFYEEESGLSFGPGFEFDLRAVANYINNINPDVRTPVMCVAGQQEVNFNECTDSNFAALKDHVYRRFSADGGVIVPSRDQLDWSVDQSMMTSGAIFSFASVARNTSKQFINRMFDEDSVCGASATASNRDRICYFQGQSSLRNRKVLTPWMGGEWNPYDKCDVRQLDLQSGNAEVIDSLCYFNEYCPAELGSGLYNNPYYANMPNQACKDRDDERTSHMNVNSRFLYNLCRHKVNEDAVCNHTQGMLGGSDGQPSEDYDVDGNLYTLHDLEAIPAGNEALFGSVLLSGGEADYGFLSASPGHIGGHQLGLRISRGGDMKVSKVPLKRTQENSRIEHWDSLESREWIPSWSQRLAEDELEYAKSTRDVGFVSGLDARGDARMSWDCPLRRRAFYGGDVEGFKPQLPSARRSRRLFGGLTGERWAHPIQSRQDGSARFGRYLTTNGFCFCPMAEEVWPGMCSVDTRLRDEHNCSLYSTVRALQGRSWGWSHTFRPRNRQNEYKTCKVQVDWPFVEGRLRDNATVGHDDVDGGAWAEASDVEARRCHVLDRIPDFAYAYASKRELRRSGVSTVERGVCHTGRVQRRYDSAKRCVRASKGARASVLRCTDNEGADVERRSSKTPPEAVSSSKFYRRLCRSCSQPPRFATRGGHSMPPESSFGLPYRVSAERAIARDLRDAICKNASECDGVLNATAWSKGQFMPALLRNPELLFSRYVDRTRPSRVYEPRRSEMPDDSRLWDRPWVYCPTRDALKTSRGCNGSISKARWRSNKVGSCYTTILESLSGRRDPFAATDICNMDGRLSDLCVAIREAQSLVASANCLRKGDDSCSLQEFVYNPSTWESSNQAFVHQTVQEFYMRTDGCTGGDDCICRADSALSELRRNNTYRLRECSAVPVMAFREVLVGLRSLVFPVCKSGALLVDIAFNLVLMMSSSARDAATSRIVLDWAQLKQESAVVFDKVSDMFFDVIFSVGSMGPYLRDNFQAACGVVNTAYVYAADVWCNLIIGQLPLFLASLRSIGGWIEVGFSVVNDVFMVVLDDKLPDAMMELYQYGYREYFQSARYREKQAAYEDRKEASLLNQKEGKAKKGKSSGLISADNRFLKNLGEARDTRMKRSTMKSALGLAQALGPLGVFGGAVDLAITGVQLYEQIQTAQKIKEMLKDFPTSFTLFDFDDFYLSIDGLVEFLNADFTCYSLSTNVTPLQCTLLNFTEPSEDDVDLIAPRASTCWAEAQQRQVGVSNLYACSATSTCCSDALHCDDTVEGVKLCSECPLPPSGVRTYGCNTMLQRCQCGVESFEVARCASQRDCGPAASCSLLTSLDDVSFGSLRTCTECSTSPICLMGSSQQYGQCSCLTSADSKVDLCGAAVGERVQASASKLCGFARDSGGYYAWSELSLVLCANALAPVCAEVVTETGALVYMSVSTRLRNGQVAFASRRLLSTENGEEAFIRLPSALMPDDPADEVTPEMVHSVITESQWNHTSAPCSTLANAYRTGRELGPVDEATLHACVYWRSVGRQLIAEHALGALENFDTFLLSASDFSASLGQRGVLRELISKPYVLLHALLYSQWAKPVRAALVASHDANVTAALQAWGRSVFKASRARLEKTTGDPWESDVKNGSDNFNQMDENGGDNFNQMDRHGSDVGSPRRGRRLLGLWEETRDRIQAAPYYSLLKSTVFNKSLPEVLRMTKSQFWMVDAFFWGDLQIGSECPVADTLSSLVGQTVDASRRYYTHLVEVNTPATVRRRFRDVLPVVVRAAGPALSGTGRPQVFQWVLDLAGLRVEDMVAFLRDPCPKTDCLSLNRWTASYMVESALFCDLDSVMLCTEHRNDLVMSVVLMVLVYVALSYLCGYLGLGAISTLFFFSIPFAALWYSIGVSPRCFPMIPTCLLDDVIASFKSLLPTKVRLPQRLVVNSTSLRPCADLHFDSWEDPLAFAWCDLGFCDGLDDATVLGFSEWKFKTMHGLATSDDADAYRVCASVTATYAVPVVMACSIFLSVISALVISSLALLGPLMTMVWQIILFDHSKNE